MHLVEDPFAMDNRKRSNSETRSVQGMHGSLRLLMRLIDTYVEFA